MKKCIATYILFVGCLIFSISGRASSADALDLFKNTANPLLQKKAQFKSLQVFSQQGNKDKRPDQYGRSLVNANAPCFSSIVPFVIEESIDLITNTGIAYTALVPRTVILKEYLLHLFPSHYFW